MDVNRTYCGDHFAVYTYIRSLGTRIEYNVICQLRLNFKKYRFGAELHLMRMVMPVAQTRGGGVVLISPNPTPLRKVFTSTQTQLQGEKDDSVALL